MTFSFTHNSISLAFSYMAKCRIKLRSLEISQIRFQCLLAQDVADYIEKIKILNPNTFLSSFNR